MATTRLPSAKTLKLIELAFELSLTFMFIENWPVVKLLFLRCDDCMTVTIFTHHINRQVPHFSPSFRLHISHQSIHATARLRMQSNVKM